MYILMQMYVYNNHIRANMYKNNIIYTHSSLYAIYPVTIYFINRLIVIRISQLSLVVVSIHTKK